MSIALWAPAQLEMEYQTRRQRAASWTCHVLLSVIVLMVAGVSVIATDTSSALAFSLLIMGLAVIAWQPRTGLYMIAFFSLAGDADTVPWYPFNKNLSSAESIMFVANSAVIKPLEICIVATVLAWLAHTIAAHRRSFVKGEAFGPVLAFTTFIVLGFLRGLTSGGDRTAAMYEARALFYLPVLYVLGTNLLVRKRHYHVLFGAIVAGIAVNSGFALHSYLTLTENEKRRLESLGEHGASLTANVLLLLVVVGWLYRSSTSRVQLSLAVMAVPTSIAFLIAQRRAAIGALIVAALAICAGLFVVNRRKFLRVVPVLALVAVAYTAVFWNASGSAGFPAQAVKSIVAPDKTSGADRSSDAYRRMEAVDIVATIRTDPIRGLGFGQRFLRPIPLPAIAKFVTAEYQPHNSFLWFWIKTGAFGFMTMLYLLGSTIQRGARAALQANDDLSLVTMISTLYVMMFAVFTYLDISWDTQSMVVLAAAISLTANVERLRIEQAEACRS